MPINEAIEVLRVISAEIVGTYGEAGALMSMEFMERYAPTEVRRGLSSLKTPVVAQEKIDATVKYAMGSWAKGIPEQTLTTMLGAYERWTKYPAREVVVQAAKRHKQARWARVPTGATTCGWCIVQASRGFSFTSEEVAAKKYHSHCDCQPVLSFRPDGDLMTRIKGYDPTPYKELYDKALDKTGDYSLQDLGAVIDSITGRPKHLPH